VWRHLERNVSDELIQCGLGGAERDHPVARTAGQPRAEVDQPAVASGNQARHNGFGDQEGGTQLAIQLAAELLPAQIRE
jgi:hypothetical protein